VTTSNYVFQKHNCFVCIPRIVESLTNIVNNLVISKKLIPKPEIRRRKPTHQIRLVVSR